MQRFPSSNYSRPSLPVALEVTESGLTGTFGDAGLAIDAKREGGGSGGGGGGSPTTSERPTTRGSGTTPGTAGTTPGTATSPGTGYVPDPFGPKLTSDEPISPKDATDAAIMVVIASGRRVP